MADAVSPTLLPAGLRERGEALLGRAIIAARRVEGGYTAAQRLVVTLADGDSAFLKIGTSALTSGWLRDEARIYGAICAPCMPRCLGFADGNDAAAPPILALEDLSTAHWPPPWTDARLDRVLAAVDAFNHATVPRELALPRVADMKVLNGAWQHVADDPALFLSTAVVTPTWLERCLPELLAFDVASGIDGSDLLHLDVRSDNCCIAGERALLVDFNWATRGHAALDRVAFAPSLAVEGRREAEAIGRSHLPSLVAIAGFFASHAGLPHPDGAHASLRPKQAQCAAIALTWLARSMALPPPDGTVVR